MERIIGVTEFQRGFRAVMDEVAEKKVPCILTRGSKPRAVLIAYEDFARLKAMEEKEVLARFDEFLARMAERNADASDDEIEAEVEAAIAEARADARRR